MGVPAFYRWLSEKYPKIVQDVLEERVKLTGYNSSQREPFDITRPNPSGLECDNLYIDMNGIIHPCSHPEVGPQPKTEEEMFENVCRYVDRLVRIMRPRRLLYLAIDGVAPRAKMNQQRARRFRSAQEARELAELEDSIRVELEEDGQAPPTKSKPWDSNVITPGTPFMLKLSEFIRFYVRKRIAQDKGWQKIQVIFSDASIPGEGEHKVMSHVRLQRSQPGYMPNLVHVLHGLDADLIMLALATHEAHFYITREEVLFGRKSQEDQDHRQMTSGFRDQQLQLDEFAGPAAMQLIENQQKPLQRISIPILREYLANEFKSCLQPNAIPFQPSLERLIDDIVFMCFFVGNDFLPHLPSLDIRVGALDFLFNVYKRILPSLGDYITSHGGKVNLSHVDIILAEVGAIEDYVFAMKHDNEQQQEKRKREQRDRRKRRPNEPPRVAPEPEKRALGKAGRILAKNSGSVALQRGHKAKEDQRHQMKVAHELKDANLQAAQALKESLKFVRTSKEEKPVKEENGTTREEALKGANDADAAAGIIQSVDQSSASGNKRNADEMTTTTKPKPDAVVAKPDDEAEDDKDVKGEADTTASKSNGIGNVDDDEGIFDVDDDDDAEEALKIKVEDVDPEVAKAFKEKVKTAQQAKLDQYAKDVEDKVRLHEAGWKDRYYSDKCKADDVENHGGREHLFRSYVMGLCWVMKYYYDGVPSWKWYYPFHYAPFASDLKNIERFQRDCNSFEISTPFNPVEQLMAVLPEDSSHAIPKAARWLMSDPESPILDFYPKDVPVDPNGKAMPWLWVVLLPFIEEDRLLAALTPTMKKWSKDELLCNVRGLDEGWIFSYRKSEFGKKLATVLKDGKTAKSAKMRLSDSAAYGVAGFSGSIRPPLSNDIYSVDEDVEVQPPVGASNIDQVSYDNLFSEPIDTNEAVCVVFSEPLKLPHKSILLPGAKPPPTRLSGEDLRIRRPKLNRFGGTIANMGMGPGQAHQSNRGNPNAYANNRAAHGYQQPGMRPWGSLEPTPKRPRHNPFASQPQQGVAHGRQQRPNLPPWQNQQNDQRLQQRWQTPQAQSHSTYNQSQARGQQQNYAHRQQQQQQPYQRTPHGNHQNRNPPPPPPPPAQPYQNRGGGRGQPQQRQQGYSFQSHNRSSAPPWQQQQHHQQGSNQSRGRVDGNTMNSLRAQLVSTLKHNQRQGGNSDRKGR